VGNILDLAIRGGTLVDGSGVPARRADVGVRNGRITEVGVVETGRREIDASGLVVSPGFIDVHTHYDAQVHWDPLCSPSPFHGATTVIGGNCGFTLAPMVAEQEDYLTRMLARVEGMSVDVLAEGMAFNWGSFAEFLAGIEGNIAVNAGFMVGHSTIRRLVMGRETGRVASGPELTRMADLLAQSIGEGGLGLSSSWSTGHIDNDGSPVPSVAASATELEALARVVGTFPGTSLGFIPGIGGWRQSDADVMAGMSISADRILNWNVLRIERASDPRELRPYEIPLRLASEAATRGAAIVALAATEPTVTRISLATGVVFANLPGWESTMALPLQERTEVFASPERRRELLEGLNGRQLNWIESALVDWGAATVIETFDPLNDGLIGRSIGEISRERDVSPSNAFFDIAVADELRTYFELPPLGADDRSWAARGTVWRDPRTVVGGSDAGAHLDVLCGASSTTAFLRTGVRERQLLSLEEAVHQLTDVPARLWGLRDRGRVDIGYIADLLVFDPDRVAPGEALMRNDLPGGFPRLYSEAQGIEHVLVNGVEIIRAGQPTGNLPGTVLRSGRDTETVTAAATAPGLAFAAHDPEVQDLYRQVERVLEG
jgi:N-acyl-D-aspartate/D-glutamate deacylase